MRTTFAAGFLLAHVYLTHVQMSSGFGTGAPSSKCRSMLPSHGRNKPQTRSHRYRIMTSHATYSPGQPITVRLTGGSFKGFLVQARTTRGRSVGTMRVSRGQPLKTVCKAGVTHSSKSKKTNVRFLWTPPKNLDDPVEFVATIVQSYTTFWMGIKSQLITPQITTKKTTPTTTTTTTTTTKITTPTSPASTTTILSTSIPTTSTTTATIPTNTTTLPAWTSPVSSSSVPLTTITPTSISISTTSTVPTTLAPQTITSIVTASTKTVPPPPPPPVPTAVSSPSTKLFHQTDAKTLIEESSTQPSTRMSKISATAMYTELVSSAKGSQKTTANKSEVLSTPTSVFSTVLHSGDISTPVTESSPKMKATISTSDLKNIVITSIPKTSKASKTTQTTETKPDTETVPNTSTNSIVSVESRSVVKSTASPVVHPVLDGSERRPVVQNPTQTSGELGSPKSKASEQFILNRIYYVMTFTFGYLIKDIVWL